MATPLDDEREQLRKAGYTDDEISRFFIERLRGQGQATASGWTATGPQMPMGGVLGNANAVLGHVRATIPLVTNASATFANPAASPKSRFRSAAILVAVAVVVGGLAFTIWQEWQQHIIYETEIKRLNAQIANINVELTTAQNEKAQAEAAVAKEVAAGQVAQAQKAKAEAEVARLVAAGQVAQAEKAKADAAVAPEVAAGQAAEARKKIAEAKYAEELAAGAKAQACSARMTMIADTLSPTQQKAALAQFDRDCSPNYAACLAEFQELLAVIKTGGLSAMGNKVEEYKSRCPYREEQRDQALEALRGAVKSPTPSLTETPSKTEAPSNGATATIESPVKYDHYDLPENDLGEFSAKTFEECVADCTDRLDCKAGVFFRDYYEHTACYLKSEADILMYTGRPVSAFVKGKAPPIYSDADETHRQSIRARM